MYNLSDLCHNPDIYLSEGEVILADGGFIGGVGLAVPIQKNTYDRMTNEDTRRVMMDLNNEFTANRLIVKDVFGWLKTRACVLDKAWPRHLNKKASIFNAACKLHNFIQMIRIDHAMRIQQPMSASHNRSPQTCQSPSGSTFSLSLSGPSASSLFFRFLPPRSAINEFPA